MWCQLASILMIICMVYEQLKPFLVLNLHVYTSLSSTRACLCIAHYYSYCKPQQGATHVTAHGCCSCSCVTSPVYWFPTIKDRGNRAANCYAFQSTHECELAWHFSGSTIVQWNLVIFCLWFYIGNHLELFLPLWQLNHYNSCLLAHAICLACLVARST